MNLPNIPIPIITSERPFKGVAHTVSGHFRLALFGVIAHLMEACANGDRSAALETYPFLQDYADEIDALIQRADPTSMQWRAALVTWENAASTQLPLLVLLRAGLSRLELELLLAAGLQEEDPRFAVLFEQVTGGERRPTAGLLLAWWRNDDEQDRIEEVRRSIRNLIQTGLLQVLNTEAPRSEWTLAVTPSVWDVLRGEPPELPWLRHVGKADLMPLSRYIAPPSAVHIYNKLPQLLAARPLQILIVRGPRQNGRKTLAGAVALELGKNILVLNAAALDDESRWRLLGVLAVLLDALPVIELALSPGEHRTLPPMPLFSGPIAVVMGAHGGIYGDDTRTLLTVLVSMPDAGLRYLHWQSALPEQDSVILNHLAQSVYLTSGNIRRAARAALSYAQLEDRNTIESRDVQLACRGLHSARLETLATRLETGGNLNDLAVDEMTRSELSTLILRCRYREPLAATTLNGGEHSIGVRALFSGPSGTGKTMAARLLAATLGKDLYRIDLSATVNKYLGETEKNIDHAFSAAEELDVIVLLDEGDALMASRTDVGSSNDRYANLETNFLLQRIESFNGILLVTTNAADRIDKAFARRMEVVIQFHAPDEWQRYQILQMHLRSHAVDDGWLQEMACRCEFTGGQLRNVVTHACLLAMDAQSLVRDEHLYAASVREYRKTGAHCPILKPKG
ncbi:MAG: ATP-binding protein [Nitrosomonas sp.]|uniref:ATP-binding protein n=1 Tax=Nitrosomonas sp. TaxID=42353 RepID=UPI0032EABF70